MPYPLANHLLPYRIVQRTRRVHVRILCSVVPVPWQRSMAAKRGRDGASTAGAAVGGSPVFASVVVGTRAGDAWNVDVMGMNRGAILDGLVNHRRFKKRFEDVQLEDCRVSVVATSGPASTPPMEDTEVEVELIGGATVRGVEHLNVWVADGQAYVHIRIHLPPPVGVGVVMPHLDPPPAYTGSVAAQQKLWEWAKGDTAPAWMPGRVVSGNRVPVPLALVHAAFGNFADALKADPPPAAVATANNMVDAMDAFFESTNVYEEASRCNSALTRHLTDLFPSLEAQESGSGYTTDGTVLAAPFDLPVLNLVTMVTEDPTAVNEATYLHLVLDASAAVRLIGGRRLHMHPAVLAALPTLPCFLLNVHGASVLEVRGVAMVGAGMISEPLSVASLRGIRGGPCAKELACLLHACVVGVGTLTAAYAALARDASPFVPVPAPSLASILCPLQLVDGRRVKCTRDLSTGIPKLAFEATVLPAAHGGGGAAAAAAAAAVAAGAVAMRGGGRMSSRLAIKLARGRYGSEVHALVAAAGHAPALHCVTPLSDCLAAVAMDLLDVRVGAWQLYCASAASTATKAAVTAAYLHAFTRDGVEYVHGDLRYGNVFIRTDVKTGCVAGVMFIDFDWAGRAGEVRYPDNLNTDVWMCGGLVGTKPGSLIPRAHDLHWLAAKGKWRVGDSE